MVSSEVGEVFLEIFEDENKNCKTIRFDNFITENTILLPIPTGPTPGFEFIMRNPLGDPEETRKAVQNFLLIRKFYFLIQRKSDTIFPLKAKKVGSESIPNLALDSTIQLEGKEYFESHVTSVRGVGLRLLLIEGPFLVVVNRASPSDQFGTVQDLLELQNIEVRNLL